MEYRLQSFSAKETYLLGRRLGEVLQGGDVICLKGDLGAGKTAFAQGVGKALNVPDNMASPTFTLMQEYGGEVSGQGVRLIHMDLYRLRHPDEVEIIGVADALQNDAICLIEWPDIAEDFLPDDRLIIEIIGNGDLPRTIIFQAFVSEWESRLAGFQAGIKN